MKTLKLPLLAASLLTCSAAFAQGAGNGPNVAPNPTAPTTPRTTSNNTLSTYSPSAVGSRGAYKADSYVLQSGNSQYANVDQNGYYNTADIIQQGGSSNDAIQKQTNDGRDNSQGARNVEYIRQNGSNSRASQSQYGVGNVAQITQGTGTTGNSATQTQNGTTDLENTGRNNMANINQSGSMSTARQDQVGNNDVARINQSAGTNNSATQSQTGKGNSADIAQSGSYNNAIQTQTSDGNAALITQTGSGSSAMSSYAEQRQGGGTGNQATTTQSAPYATYSYTEQMGNNNAAVVTQRYQ